jgi:F420-0:gamma-glutamyl ligase
MEFKERILIVVTHTVVEDMEGTMAEDKVQEGVMAEEMVGTAAEDMEDTEEGVEEVVVEGVEC